MFEMKNPIFAIWIVIVILLGLFTTALIGTVGRPWREFTTEQLTGMIMAFGVITTLLTMGIHHLMIADNEDNKTVGYVHHYFKLTGAIILIMLSAVIYGAAMLPIAIPTAIQVLMPIYSAPATAQVPASTKAPIISLASTSDDLLNANNLEVVEVKVNSLPPEKGTVHITVVLEKGDEDLKILVPKTRQPQQGQIWFEHLLNGNKVQTAAAPY